MFNVFNSFIHLFVSTVHTVGCDVCSSRHHVHCVINFVWQLLCRWTPFLTWLPTHHSPSAAGRSRHSRFSSTRCESESPLQRFRMWPPVARCSLTRTIIASSSPPRPFDLGYGFHATVCRSDASTLGLGGVIACF